MISSKAMAKAERMVALPKSLHEAKTRMKLNILAYFRSASTTNRLWARSCANRCRWNGMMHSRKSVIILPEL
jgi:hypothetical protein